VVYFFTTFTFIDTQTGQVHETVLEVGRTVSLGEMSPHQLEALQPNSMIFEVSTADSVEDNYRIQPGDSQSATAEST
jgi:hypothetical protein